MRAFRRMTGPWALTLSVLALLVVGCGGGGGGGGTNFGPSAPPDSTSALIGPAGGAVEVPEGELDGTKLVVPAGALDQEEEINISAGRDVSSEQKHYLVGPAVSIQPNGLTFAGDGATLRIPYDVSSLPPGTVAENLTVLKKVSDGTIYELEVVALPAGGDFLEVKVGSLSSFQAVLSTVDASGQWIMGSFGGEFDLEDFDFGEFDFGDFDPEDFDWENFDWESFDRESFDWSQFDFGDFDPENFDPENFDWEDFDWEDFDLGNFDLGNFDLGNFDLGNFDLGNFDLGSFDLGSFDLGSFDLGNFDLGNFDLGNFDLGNFDLGSLFDLGGIDLAEMGILDGLPVDFVEIVQDTDKGTVEITTNKTDADGKTIKLIGTFTEASYQASATYPGENGTETIEVEFELLSENFGSGSMTTTIGSEVTTESLGLARTDSLIQEPTFGAGINSLTLTISDTSEPSDPTLPASSLEEGSYEGTLIQLGADEILGLVIATYVLDSDTGNPFVGTVSGSEYIFVRMVESEGGGNMIEILQLTRTSTSTFESGTLAGSGFAWIYSAGAEGMNFGTGSSSFDD